MCSDAYILSSNTRERVYTYTPEYTAAMSQNHVQVFTELPPHSMLRITMSIIKIDSAPDERVQIFIDECAPWTLKIGHGDNRFLFADYAFANAGLPNAICAPYYILERTKCCMTRYAQLHGACRAAVITAATSSVEQEQSSSHD